MVVVHGKPNVEVIKKVAQQILKELKTKGEAA